jgi:hypothetical protein
MWIEWGKAISSPQIGELYIARVIIKEAAGDWDKHQLRKI